MRSEQIAIGMDDIDSPNGGCTTHFASLLIEYLEEIIDEWLDYPHLIRLNPNIPYRTRGNGSVSLQFTINSSYVDEILPTIRQMVNDYADLSYPNTNPGVVICRHDIPKSLTEFANRALWRTIPVSLAMRTITKLKLSYFAEGNERGTIGALAAIGHKLDADHTYEYIAYRNMNLCHEPRGVDQSSVIELDELLGDRTFSNIDLSSEHVLIEPQGPDPVLYGIRGNDPKDVFEGASHVRSKQKPERWMIFRTNQATGEHLQHQLKISQLRPYMSVRVRGVVNEPPRIIEGGHVIFRVEDDTSSIDCAAYEPTGDFRWVVNRLIVGDEIMVHAGVRPASRAHGLTLNLEGMEILSLVDEIHVSNPLCNECGHRMKSAGKNKGFKCPSCGHKDTVIRKNETHASRNIEPGIYLPRMSAQRHLTRPISRLGLINGPHNLIPKWHNP